VGHGLSRFLGITCADRFQNAAQDSQLDRALLGGIAERARKFAGQQMQGGGQKAEKRIAAGPTEQIVKPTVQILELASSFIALKLFKAIGERAEVARIRALGGIGRNIRRYGFTQFEEALQVCFHELQDERKTIREITGLRARDHRPATSAQLKVDYALKLQKAERFTQGCSGNFVPREHFFFAWQTVSNNARSSFNVANDVLCERKCTLCLLCFIGPGLQI
jgi:hypothetical protein